MGIVEEYSELSKWYQKEKALNRELHTENNKLQAEVERLKKESPVSGAEQGKPPATFHNEDTITQAKAALEGKDAERP